MAATRFGIAVLGTGIMGRRMLAALQQHPRFRVVAAWDPDAAALQAALAMVPGAHAADTAEALFDDATVDVVYVASPPGAHAGAVRRALQAGKPCLCEKPLTHDTAEAEALRDAVLGAGLPFAVNFPFARSVAANRLREIVQGGEIGRIESAHVRLRFARWPREWQAGASPWLAGPAEGGFTREVLSHFLFLTRRQLGPLTLTTAQATYPAGDGAETAIRAEMTAGGVPVTVTGSVGRTTADETNEWRLSCEAGAIRLRNWSIAEKQAADGSWATAPDALPNEKKRPLVLKGQLDKLAALTRGETTDLATLREALEVQEVVEAILGA